MNDGPPIDSASVRVSYARVSESSNSNHKGVDEDDCEAIKFHARELMQDILSYCAEHHQHDNSQKRVA